MRDCATRGGCHTVPISSRHFSPRRGTSFLRHFPIRRRRWSRRDRRRACCPAAPALLPRLQQQLSASRRRPARPCAWMSAQYAGAPAPTPTRSVELLQELRGRVQVAALAARANHRADGDTATVGGLRHRGNFKELEHRVETASIAELFDASRERLAAKRTRTTATAAAAAATGAAVRSPKSPAEPEPGEIADGARERRRGGCVVAKFASPKLGPTGLGRVGRRGAPAPDPVPALSSLSTGRSHRRARLGRRLR